MMQNTTQNMHFWQCDERYRWKVVSQKIQKAFLEGNAFCTGSLEKRKIFQTPFLLSYNSWGFLVTNTTHQEVILFPPTDLKYDESSILMCISQATGSRSAKSYTDPTCYYNGVNTVTLPAYSKLHRGSKSGSSITGTKFVFKKKISYTMPAVQTVTRKHKLGDSGTIRPQDEWTWQAFKEAECGCSTNNIVRNQSSPAVSVWQWATFCTAINSSFCW